MMRKLRENFPSWFSVNSDCIFLGVLCQVIVVLIFLVGATTTCAISGSPKNQKELVETLRNQTTTIRGEKVSVNLLLRAIGRKTKVNVMVDETITETITLDLENVNLYNLFQLILETKNLRYYESNNAIIVEKAEDFKKDQRDVVTKRLCSKYGQVGGQVEELSVLKSEDGSLTASADGNCVIVRDHLDNVRKITELFRQLDQPIPQVHIKARIVSIEKSISEQLGIKWGYTDLSELPSDSLTMSSDLSAASPTTSIVFGFIRDSFTLDVELSALKENEKLEILSEPRIVVLDGQEAEIKQGKEVPYESGTADAPNTTFREAVLSLTVTPKILKNENIRLDVKVTNDSVDENSTEDGQPLINRQEIRTNLFLEDGVTVVIGGIMSQQKDETKGKVPWMADLPWVGGLFRSTDSVDTAFELLVFLTPTVLTGKHSAASNGVNLLSENKKFVSPTKNPRSTKKSSDGSRSSKLLLYPLQLRD